MIEEQLGEFFAEEGYTKIPSNLPEFTIYFRRENNYVNVFHVINYRQNLYISEDQYLHLKDKIRQLFSEKGENNIHIQSLIISRDMQKARQLCAEDAQCWMVDPYDRRLVIYENQVSDFYGMKEKLEFFLTHIDVETKKESVRKQNFHMTVTAFLVFVNILIFIICTFTGELLYNIGALDAMSVVDNKEYYRIFTSVFLHADVNHLFSNMVVLYYLGESVEKYFGSLRYIILYLLAGSCGNLVSIVHECVAGLLISSVGASGAIFGIIGAVFVLVIVHKGHWKQITFGRLVFMIAYSLYSGFVASNINNAAHVGGFVSGIVIALVLWALQRVKSSICK